MNAVQRSPLSLSISLKNRGNLKQKFHMLGIAGSDFNVIQN